MHIIPVVSLVVALFAVNTLAAPIEDAQVSVRQWRGLGEFIERAAHEAFGRTRRHEANGDTDDDAFICTRAVCIKRAVSVEPIAYTGDDPLICSRPICFPSPISAEPIA